MSGVPGDHRRKWDRDEYEKKAAERLKCEKGEKKENNSIKLSVLKGRHYKVDLESKLGKSVLITKTTPASHGPGFYCNVCDFVAKDSISFLNHINGKQHQKNLGMSMKVERSTADDVKQRLELLKKKTEEKNKDYNIREKIQELNEEEEKLREYRQVKKKEAKRRKHDNEDIRSEVDDEMAVMMGFAGFGSSKKALICTGVECFSISD